MGGNKETGSRKEHTEKGKERGERTERQSMGSSMLQAQMQLEQKIAARNKFAFEESPKERAIKGRYAGEPGYEARYQSWVKSKIEGMDAEIDRLTRSLQEMQQASTTDAPQTGPSYGYNPQTYAHGEGYSYGAVSGAGGDLNRMNTVARSQQYDVGYYGSSSAAPAGGDQGSTQRSSFAEEVARQQQEQEALQGQHWLAGQNPDWLAQQDQHWSDEQRQHRGRRRPPNQDG